MEVCLTDNLFEALIDISASYPFVGCFAALVVIAFFAVAFWGNRYVKAQAQ
jgi:hypothetical protein